MAPDEAWARLHAPDVTAAELAQIASEHPALRPYVASHPLAYPELLAWLAAWHDPATDAALAARQAPAPVVPAPSAPPTRPWRGRLGAGAIAAIVAGALVLAGGATAAAIGLAHHGDGVRTSGKVTGRSSQAEGGKATGRATTPSGRATTARADEPTAAAAPSTTAAAPTTEAPPAEAPPTEAPPPVAGAAACDEQTLRQAVTTDGSSPLAAPDTMADPSVYFYDYFTLHACTGAWALVEASHSSGSSFDFWLMQAQGDWWRLLTGASTGIGTPADQPLFTRADLLASGIDPDAVVAGLGTNTTSSGRTIVDG